jgi:eukaryotic-like serine/threonine-protein kinase
VVGETIADRYELEELVGHGGMSSVYKAHDSLLERYVALKFLHEQYNADDDFVERFKREARLVAQLQHPNIVTVIDRGEEDGRQYIVFEYIDGENLKEFVVRKGRLDVPEALEIALEVARALAFAHDAGLVHRDVKPQNLLLRTDGVLKLGDFGVAFGLEGTRLTMAGTVLGTAAYLAPEQARGEDVTAAADVYGLGAVLFELLTGRPPRNPATLAELADTETIPTPQDAPPDLARIVMQCLAAKPEDRPASAAELAGELAATVPEPQTLPLPGHPSLRATEIRAPAPSARRRPRTAVLLAVVAAIAVVAGVTAALTTGGSPPPTPKPVPKVSGLPVAPSAQQEARDLAAWLRKYSG